MTKKLHIIWVIIFFPLFLLAQVSLSSSPTLTFTQNSTAITGDNVASDGEAGSQAIADIDIQIYNISDVNGTFLPSLSWKNNNWLASSTAAYSALTTNDFSYYSKGMAIKSADGSEFQLIQFVYYNWGEDNPFTNTIKGYRNGSEVASMTFEGFDFSYNPKTITLTSGFQNVDEVRFYISSGGYIGNQSGTNHSINSIKVSSPVVPITTPTVSTITATNIGAVKATLGGNSTASGGATVTERGIVWATTANPTTLNNKIAIGTGTGSFSAIVSSLPAATLINYRSYATNSEGTSYGANVTFTTNTALSASQSQTNISCNSGSNGSATVTPSGGKTTYTYSWSPSGGTSATASGLSAGDYSCTITDSEGSSVTKSFTITQPTAITLSKSSQTNLTCYGDANGAASVSNATGGTSGYTYDWSPGTPTGDGTTSVSGLTAGDWTCTVTDANGCTTSQSFTITQPTALTAPTTSPVTYLKNATASPLTATGTSLLWYNAAMGGTANTTAPTPSTAVAGTTTYYVASSNSNGCQSTRTALTVTVTSPATHLNFDGVNDYIRIPKPTTSDFTLEYWIKTTDTGSNSSQWYGGKGIVDAEQGGVTNDFGTSLVNSKLAFGVGNPDITIFSTSAINTGEWKHVSVSWKQATGQMKLYIDGNLEASATGSTLTRNSTPEIVIGALQYNSNYFNGSIDELRIWNTVRTVEQINSSKNCELEGNETGLVSYYKFNQGNDQANNTAQNTLTNTVSGYTNPALNNFALTGATSNWLAGSVIQTGSTCATLSTTNFNKSNSIKVYPNPTSNFVTIEASTVENATIQISDVSGRILVSKNISETTNTIDLSPLQNGVYIFKIKTQDGESVTKVIKQ